jgi:hypothetical protein
MRRNHETAIHETETVTGRFVREHNRTPNEIHSKRKN